MQETKKKRKKTSDFYRRQDRWALLMMTPWLIGVVFFFVKPLVEVVIYSLNDIQVTLGGLDQTWVGLQNFKYVLREHATFYQDLIRTFSNALPNTVLIIPRFILFNRLGWNDTYYPFIVPALFACTPFFIYMMIQFFRGIPRDLDDAAKIDGCSSFKTLIYVLLPILKPALFSAFLFQFIWTWNDFFNVLIYISSVSKYPVSLALRMSLDSASAVNWSTVLAMSLVSMIPCILVYMFGQKYLIDGMATQGIKG